MGRTSSTSATNLQTGAILAGARTVTCASGRPFLIARAAGMDMIASPSQLLERIRMRNGFKFFGDVLDGKYTPRLYRANRNLGRGVFHRLCTQNQSFGARVI